MKPAASDTPRDPDGRRRSTILIALAVLGATLLLQLPFFDRWFSAMDEGHMLAFADLVARGGDLYRDATIYPLPGSFYLLALLFQLFEPSNLLARWVVTLQFALFVALVFLWLGRIVPLGWALLGVLLLWLYRIWAFPHWQIYNYSTTTLLLLVICFLLLLRALEDRGRSWLAASGLVFGLAVFCKQDYGAAGLLAVVAVLAVESRREGPGALRRLGTRLATFLVPAAAVGAAAGLYFLHRGILGDVVQMTVLNHFVGMATYEYSSFPDLWPLLGEDPNLRTPVGRALYMPAILFTVDWEGFQHSVLYTTRFYDLAIKGVFYGPYALVAAALMRLAWIRPRDAGASTLRAWRAELLLAAFAATSILLITMNKPQDYLHLAVLLWPLVVLVPVWARALLRTLPSRARPAVVLAGVLALVVATAASGRLALRLRSVHPEPVGLARAGIHVKPSEARMLRDVVAYLDEHSAPGEPVAVLPYFPILHFLADRPGFHGAAYILWPFPEFPDRDARVVRALEEQQVRVGIYNHTQFQGFPPVRDYAPEVFRHLVEHFETDRVFAYDFFGYKLAGFHRQPARPGRPLLDPRLEGVTLEIEPFARRPRPLPRSTWTEHLRFDVWPFRRVVALRPAPLGSRRVLSVPVAVPPEGGTLETAIGFFPEDWFTYPGSWVRFTVDVEADGQREQLFSRKLDPHRDFADRGWFAVSASLDRHAGRTIRLRFSTEAERETGEELGMGGWELPRLVGHPPWPAGGDRDAP